jgi:hypothetical protein
MYPLRIYPAHHPSNQTDNCDEIQDGDNRINLCMLMRVGAVAASSLDDADSSSRFHYVAIETVWVS